MTKLRAHFALAILCTAAILTVHSAAKAQSREPSAQSATRADTPLAPAAAAALQKRVEVYLRNLYAWGPSFAVTVGPLTEAPAGDLYQTTVDVAADGGSDSALVYVSKDGRYVLRGDLEDMNVDPYAKTRQDMHLDGYPSKGPADAKVVVVEFGDFECPSCRQLEQVLRAVLPQHPDVRFVFKDFPLEQIHPWAMMAATAGRCALQQSPEAFWKLHDAIYDNQDVISPENAFDKLTELATAAGAEPGAVHTCMADTKTADAVHQSLEEGKHLQVTSTPTVFVDGRRFVGPNPDLLEQFISFDLQATANPQPREKKPVVPREE